jgi:hypothetical protein
MRVRNVRILDAVCMKGYCHLNIHFDTRRLFFCWVDINRQRTGPIATVTSYFNKGTHAARMTDPVFLHEGRTRNYNRELRL